MIHPRAVAPSTGTTITNPERLQVDPDEQSHFLEHLITFINNYLAVSSFIICSPRRFQNIASTWITEGGGNTFWGAN